MNLLRVSFVAGAIAALCGCGSDLVNVKGSVEREGSPLLAGKVVMTPVGGGRVAFGEIQSDGSFRLTSERANDGAAPGQYRLRVIETQVTGAALLRTSHEGPRDQPIEIAPGKNQELVIRIRQDEGWVTQADN